MACLAVAWTTARRTTTRPPKTTMAPASTWAPAASSRATGPSCTTTSPWTTGILWWSRRPGAPAASARCPRPRPTTGTCRSACTTSATSQAVRCRCLLLRQRGAQWLRARVGHDRLERPRLDAPLPPEYGNWRLVAQGNLEEQLGRHQLGHVQHPRRARVFPEALGRPVRVQNVLAELGLRRVHALDPVPVASFEPRQHQPLRDLCGLPVRRGGRAVPGPCLRRRHGHLRRTALRRRRLVRRRPVLPVGRALDDPPRTPRQQRLRRR